MERWIMYIYRYVYRWVCMYQVSPRRWTFQGFSPAPVGFPLPVRPQIAWHGGIQLLGCCGAGALGDGAEEGEARRGPPSGQQFQLLRIRSRSWSVGTPRARLGRRCDDTNTVRYRGYEVDGVMGRVIERVTATEEKENGE